MCFVVLPTCYFDVAAGFSRPYDELTIANFFEELGMELFVLVASVGGFAKAFFDRVPECVGGDFFEVGSFGRRAFGVGCIAPTDGCIS